MRRLEPASNSTSTGCSAPGRTRCTPSGSGPGRESCPSRRRWNFWRPSWSRTGSGTPSAVRSWNSWTESGRLSQPYWLRRRSWKRPKASWKRPKPGGRPVPPSGRRRNSSWRPRRHRHPSWRACGPNWRTWRQSCPGIKSWTSCARILRLKPRASDNRAPGWRSRRASRSSGRRSWSRDDRSGRAWKRQEPSGSGCWDSRPGPRNRASVWRN